MYADNGISQMTQHKLNRRLVVKLLRKNGLCSRAALSNESGLTPATITNIINEFIDSKLVIEDGVIDNERGRKSIGIRINPTHYGVIGIMVTRKFYCACIMGLSGEIFKINTVLIDSQISNNIISVIKKEIDSLIASFQETKVLAIGMALPGPYKHEKDELVFVTNSDSWNSVSVSKELHKSFDMPVFIENDANAGAYAQFWFQNKNRQNLCYIVAGQGIGCGIIVKGELMRGGTDIAGEIGHISIDFNGRKCKCGNCGCLELYSSYLVLETNIKRRINYLNDKSVLDAHFSYADIVEAIRKRDSVVMEEYRKVCEYLAVGVINLINLLNPESIIIGDQLAKINPEIMLKIINNKVRKSIKPIILENISIEIDNLPHNPILIGAGVIAINNIFEDLPEYFSYSNS